jgi:hypothetical protein
VTSLRGQIFRDHRAIARSKNTMNATTKARLLECRVFELRSVLYRLNLPISGKKEDLRARIYRYLGEHQNDILPERKDYMLKSASELTPLLEK